MSEQTKRPRRAEPITKRVAVNGAISYTFQADVGTKPDGSRDRRRFTYPTQAQARRELRRITSEVAAGTYARRTALTVDEACDEWLAGKRGIRTVTIEGYRNNLKPVRRHLGGRQIQQLTKADVDSLVEWMQTEGRRSPKHHQAGSLMGQVVDLISQHPQGISAADIKAAFPGDDVHTCLSGLVRSGRVTRPRRAVYTLTSDEAAPPAQGVKPVSVRSTLGRFSAVIQSFVDQGVLPRNVVALVDRPGDKGRTATSLTTEQAEQFRDSVRGDRLFACWLLSLYGLRRSEVLGLKWTDITDDGILHIKRSRVQVRSGWEFGEPKSERSRRKLPMPEELAEALRALKMRQKTEALALGVSWSDDQLVAVREDGEPVRHGWYSAQFKKLSGLTDQTLKRLRNTSVTVMMDRNVPVHIVAAWHGHDPSVSASTYAVAKEAQLRLAGAALFG